MLIQLGPGSIIRRDLVGKRLNSYFHNVKQKCHMRGLRPLKAEVTRCQLPAKSKNPSKKKKRLAFAGDVFSR